jgi:RNA polymerase sigma-70 factor (ECF subfamily)
MEKNGNCNKTFSQAAIEHIHALYGFAVALTRDQTEAEDLVQETYLRAVQAFGRLVPDSNLKAWLFVIMRNIWLNQVRHERNGPRFVELEPQQQSVDGNDPAASDPYFICVTKLECEQVRKAIESLPLAHREVIVLRDLEGFSYQQIAGILDCPAGTVMSRIARAREKLRRLITRWPAAMPAKEH